VSSSTETDRIDQARARAGVYRLLSAVYLQEINGTLLAALRVHDSFGATIAARDEDDFLRRLRVEYARLFVMNVYPYESAYVEAEVMLNTAVTQAVVEAYQAVGYAPELSRPVGAPDHIGIELDLMRVLAEREAHDLAAGDLPAAEEDRARQRAFLTEHLASWGPVFALSVVRDTRLPLYREIGGFTAEFLLADLDLLTAAGPWPERNGLWPPAALPPVPPDLSLRDIAHSLTTPARAGFHLSREELFRLAGQLELPLAPVERWLMLEQLFQSAARYGQLRALLTGLGELAARASGTYTEWQQCFPGAALAIEPWEQRAHATATALREMQTVTELAMNQSG
jgi:TorA maturation chaperone TorD